MRLATSVPLVVSCRVFRFAPVDPLTLILAPGRVSEVFLADDVSDASTFCLLAPLDDVAEDDADRVETDGVSVVSVEILWRSFNSSFVILVEMHDADVLDVASAGGFPAPDSLDELRLRVCLSSTVTGRIDFFPDVPSQLLLEVFSGSFRRFRREPSSSSFCSAATGHPRILYAQGEEGTNTHAFRRHDITSSGGKRNQSWKK